jgi:hypothetical protein
MRRLARVDGRRRKPGDAFGGAALIPSGIDGNQRQA